MLGFLGGIAVAVAVLAIVLAATIFFELSVAAVFGLGGRELHVVAWINVATNPVLNLILGLLLWLSIWGVYAAELLLPVALVVGEVVVVIVEWWALAAVLGARAGGRWRLLALSVSMNLASLAGGFVLAAGVIRAVDAWAGALT